MPLVLGVDSSTQSTKVEVRDAEDGRLVGSARAPHPAVHPPRSEQEPEAWWEALCLTAAEATADGAHAVDAVSVAGQQHGMVLLDGDGSVLRPAKLWNDTESAPEAASMVDRLGREVWASRTGSVPLAAFTVTKLAWLVRHEPDTARAIRSVLLPHDYLTFRLTGRRVTDRGDASGTGYFDPVGGTWLADLLDEVVGPAPWGERLPTVLGPTEAVGPLGGRERPDSTSAGWIWSDRAPATTWRRRSESDCRQARRASPSGHRARSTPAAIGPWPTPRARWPGLPTPVARSSRWPAR